MFQTEVPAPPASMVLESTIAYGVRVAAPYRPASAEVRV
ncbi:MAG: hypothetical protein QOD04_2095 [Pseudonocardiales bacterium]|nr:hypothetical protein [Pseudonocardiales bacterium]